MHSKVRKSWIPWSLVIIWGIGVSFWCFLFASYAHQGTYNVDVPNQLPPYLDLPEQDDTYRLLMFAHPKCPCTRSSIAELGKLMANRRLGINAYVYFYQPESQPDSWSRTDLWNAVERIPNTQPLKDRNGHLAKRMSVNTSGEVLLYSPDGDLVFHGGITHSRGHQGDNIGTTAIADIVSGQVPKQTRTPAFGCANSIDKKFGIYEGEECKR